METIVANYKRQFWYYKGLAEKAIVQISDEQLFYVPADGSNSVAIIMKHIAGNMLSRWTDIFSTDGEKEGRQRDQEFEISEEMDKAVLLAYWDKAWARLELTLDSITDGDLEKIVHIRNTGHTVQEAIIRQICHYPYHIGQIVYACKLLTGEKFHSLSIPIGESKAYNSEKFAKAKSRKHFTEDL